MIILKHVDQNFTGAFQLLNKTTKFFLLFFIANSFAQVSDYEEYLRFLPDSVRSSVESRITTDVEDNSDYDELNQLEKESFLEMEEKLVEYDEFDNVVPSFFGYDLFDIETSFDSSGIIAAPKEYVLGPGDELTISFSGSVQAIKKVSVNREGNVFLRELGTISFSGLTFDEASEKLKNITQASLIGTEVEISLSRLRTIQIFVLGNSKRPGSYNFSPLSSISSILFNTRGPTENGSLRNISLKRANKEIGSLDMYELLINANTSDDLRIQSGDALLVNPVGDRVKIWGNVNRPAIYEIKEGETFEDVLNFASGLSSKADKNKITLSRLNDNGEREFSDYKLIDINSVKLKDSDEIFIHDLPGKLSNNIRIEGFTTSRGVYSFIENSKISDFIDENDLSDKTYLPFSVISRRDDNGSREFITTDLNLKTREEFKLKPSDFIYVFSQYDIDFINSALLADALGLLSEEDKIKIDLFYQEEKKKNQALQNASSATPDPSLPFQRQPTKSEAKKKRRI